MKVRLAEEDNKTTNMRFLFFFGICIMQLSLYAQGCADAGFCTMGAMRPDQSFSKKVDVSIKSIEISHYTGITKFHNVISAYTADLNIGINNKTSVQIKAPYMFTSGKLGKTNGFGDLSFSGTYLIKQQENYQLNITIGGKAPLNKSNLADELGRVLPMYYQTSLGTIDFITGLSLKTNKWLIATGWQKPLKGNKPDDDTRSVNNTFWWEPWKGTEQWEDAKKYSESFWFKRRADVMLRIQRDFRFSKWAFNTGLLGIYRFKDDVWWNKTNMAWENVPHTSGLALTALFAGGYNFNTQHSIKFSGGRRVIKRHHHSDGLSREWVGTISYLYKFQ